jgi:L,D-peptidoglycan transpeptidase YkuD (ErfK/YbiS/YcfS/YnhG family)
MRRSRGILIAAAVIALSLSMAADSSATPGNSISARFAPPIPMAARFTGHISSSTTQIIVVSAPSWRSTTGTLTVYTSDGKVWHRITSMPARLGYGGLVPASHRVQDTGTTPAGQFAMTETFGRLPNPGTTMSYVKLTSDDWWVEDRRSHFYNQMRPGSAGGFRLSTTGFNSSEHLMAMGSQYDYVAVINFNRPTTVIGRGAGIFLHANASGLTAGCVSVDHDRMRSILRWLDPHAHPRIIIGPAAWLATPLSS